MSLVSDILNNQTFVKAFKAGMPYFINVDQIWCDSASKSELFPLSKSGFYCYPNYYIKKSDSCDTFYLVDSSNYCNGLACPYTVISTLTQESWLLPNDIIQYSVDFKDRCSLEYENILSTTTFPQNQTTAITASKGDGCYRVNITVSVDVYDNIDIGREPDLVFLRTIQETYTVETCIDCCECERDNLFKGVKKKLGSISCKINNNEQIGKNTTNLYNNMYKLENILWVLENFVLDCKCVRQLKCAYDKIKNC